jgi:uncharacterized protein YlzI (FlbEa/FlbD family)
MPNFITLTSANPTSCLIVLNAAHIESIHCARDGEAVVFMSVVTSIGQEYYPVRESIQEILDLIYQTPE